MRTTDIDTLVTGGTGFIGRWLLLELTARGRCVAALVRGAEARAPELLRFVAERGGDASKLLVLDGDVTVEGLGLEASFPRLRDVYHLAARMAFGLTQQEARRANVAGTLNVLRWAAQAPGLRRFVELGGYRLTRAPAGLEHPLDERRRARLYREHGAYEASKYEAHVALVAEAKRLDVPVTSVHPSGVVGDSRTGECTQTDGLAETVEALWRGRLPALAGSPNTFVPIVAVDYLAAFLATVVERDELVGSSLVVLDDETPNLPELVSAMAQHLGVPAPRRVVPLAWLRQLPSSLTGLHREAIGFLSEDRYDVAAAKEHARAVGLAMPPWRQVLHRWLDHLVATRFRRQPGDGGLHPVAGTQLFVSGDPTEAEYVMLHGLPWNGDSWQGLRQRLPGSSCAVDLPGLARSGASQDPLRVLETLLAGRREPMTLVAHSLGTELAVRLAAAHPHRVRRLVLVAPFFAQAKSPWWMGCVSLMTVPLRFGGVESLSGRLDVGATGDASVMSAHDDLTRSGVALRTARALAGSRRPETRRELAQALDEISVPVMHVVGERDPLVRPVPGEVCIIDGAGHSPHVSHASIVAERISNDPVRAVRALGEPPRRGKSGLPTQRSV